MAATSSSRRGDRVVIHNEDGSAAPGKRAADAPDRAHDPDRRDPRRAAVSQFRTATPSGPLFDTFLSFEGARPRHPGRRHVARRHRTSTASSWRASSTSTSGSPTAAAPHNDSRIFGTPQGLDLVVWAGGGNDTVTVHGIGGADEGRRRRSATTSINVHTVADGDRQRRRLQTDEADELNAISGVLARLTVDGENHLIEEAVLFTDRDEFLQPFLNRPAVVRPGLQGGTHTVGNPPVTLPWYDGILVAILTDTDAIRRQRLGAEGAHDRARRRRRREKLYIQEEGVLEKATQKVGFDASWDVEADLVRHRTAARRSTRRRPASRCWSPAPQQVYVTLDFNKVLDQYGANVLTNGSFAEFVPSTDQRRRLDAVNIDDNGGWRTGFGGSFILNDDGDSGSDPQLRQTVGASCPASATASAGASVTSTAPAPRASPSWSAPPYVTVTFSRRARRRRLAHVHLRLHRHGDERARSASRARSATTCATASTTSGCSPENLPSYVTQFGAPTENAELFIDGTGRKVTTDTGPPVADPGRQHGRGRLPVHARPDRGRRRLRRPERRLLEHRDRPGRDARHVLRAGAPAAERPAGDLRRRDRIRAVPPVAGPPASHFGGELVLRPVHRRAGHVPGGRRPDRLQRVRRLGRPRSVRQPAPLRRRRHARAHRRRSRRAPARHAAGVARRRADVRRARQPDLHGRQPVPARRPARSGCTTAASRSGTSSRRSAASARSAAHASSQSAAPRPTRSTRRRRSCATGSPPAPR